MKILLPCLLAAALVANAAPAAAQTLPGFRGDYDAARAQFRAYALGEFHEILNEWVAAVNARETERALELYAPSAYVQLDERATNREAAREVLEEWVQSIDVIRVGLRDFDASGSMSYGMLNVIINAADPDENGQAVMLFVMKRDGDGWKIRSQTLVRNESAGA